MSRLRRHLESLGNQVLAGPFRGMPYLAYEESSSWLPKLLGTYEKEISPFIEQVIAIPPQQVLVVGAAEGYYAVGLLKRLADIQVTAFESHPEVRRWMERLAKKNGVQDRLMTSGHCEVSLLKKTLTQSSTFILMDVEGAEKELLDLSQIPALTSATMLVEIHEHVWPEIEALLLKRFASTHHITSQRPQKRTAIDLPTLALKVAGFFAPTRAQQWMNEGRGGRTSWLYFSPKVLVSKQA